MQSTYAVCGVNIVAVTGAEAADAVVAAARARQRLVVHLCNAYTLSLAAPGTDLRAQLQRSDLNLADGTPVAWLLPPRGRRRPVRGPDLVLDVVRAGGDGLSHYLYGGREGVAGRMAEQLARLTPGARFAGLETPPFRRLHDDEVAALARRVVESGADLVWVGIGTPAQDELVDRLAPLLERPLIPVGAAFDFISGDVRTAPAWLHGSGFEWLYRLTREPKRLWRRYTIGNARFVVAVLRDLRSSSTT